MSQENRRFIASGLMLVLMCALLYALVSVEIPQANRDLAITILAVLVGAGSAAIPNLFGDRDGEKDKLKGQVQSLEWQLSELQSAHNTLKAQYDTLTRMLIERHVVQGVGIVAPDAEDSDFQDTTPAVLIR